MRGACKLFNSIVHKEEGVNEKVKGVVNDNINIKEQVSIGTWNVGKALRRVSVEQYRHIAKCCQIVGMTEIGVKSITNFEEVVSGQMLEDFKWFVKPRKHQHKKAKSSSGGVAMGICKRGGMNVGVNEVTLPK